MPAGKLALNSPKLPKSRFARLAGAQPEREKNGSSKGTGLTASPTAAALAVSFRRCGVADEDWGSLAARGFSPPDRKRAADHQHQRVKTVR